MATLLNSISFVCKISFLHKYRVIYYDYTVKWCSLIVAKVFESIVLGWVDDIVGERIDDNQFGGVGGTSTSDALVEMTHKWYEATDVLNNYVRVVLLDFSKAFDLINHHIL